MVWIVLQADLKNPDFTKIGQDNGTKTLKVKNKEVK